MVSAPLLVYESFISNASFSSPPFLGISLDPQNRCHRVLSMVFRDDINSHLIPEVLLSLRLSLNLNRSFFQFSQYVRII